MDDDPAGAAPPAWRRDEPDSPCIQLCVIDPASGYCMGCGRTGDEIAAWSRLDPESRSAVRAALPARLAATEPRRGRTSSRRRRRERD